MHCFLGFGESVRVWVWDIVLSCERVSRGVVVDLGSPEVVVAMCGSVLLASLVYMWVHLQAHSVDVEVGDGENFELVHE